MSLMCKHANKPFARPLALVRVSVPSWQVALNDAPEVFLILNILKLSDELDCPFLGVCLIFVSPAPQRLLVIHRGDDPPTAIVITSNPDQIVGAICVVNTRLFCLGSPERLGRRVGRTSIS